MLAQLLPLIIIIAVILFWAWMFNEMLHNDDIPSIEPRGLRWPPQTKNHWIVFFIVLSFFTAGYYYLTIYRQK